MFTGIIEEVGKVVNVFHRGNSAVLEILCKLSERGIKIGDSIAVNGICLTVISFGSGRFSADASEETLTRTSLKNVTVGSKVNLERAIAADGRFDGHMVLGHVDDTGIVLNVRKDGDFYTFEISVPQKLRKYISEKGSVAIDGISLTVASDLGGSFTIAVIPHTYKETNLSLLKSGDIVNIEVDVIARYLEKLMESKGSESRLAKLLEDF